MISIALIRRAEPRIGGPGEVRLPERNAAPHLGCAHGLNWQSVGYIVAAWIHRGGNNVAIVHI